MDHKINQSSRDVEDVADITKRRSVGATKERQRKPLRIGLLGCGAINSKVAEMIEKGDAGPAVLAAVLVSSPNGTIKAKTPITATANNNCHHKIRQFLQHE